MPNRDANELIDLLFLHHVHLALAGSSLSNRNRLSLFQVVFDERPGVHDARLLDFVFQCGQQGNPQFCSDGWDTQKQRLGTNSDDRCHDVNIYRLFEVSFMDGNRKKVCYLPMAAKT